jgi:hypothetical protein
MSTLIEQEEKESTYMHELHGDQLEALLLESLDDLAHESALDAIGLDHDEGLLLVCFGGHFRLRWLFWTI